MRYRSLIVGLSCAGAAVLAVLFMSGSSLKITLGAAMVLAPVALLVAWKRPMLFPYAVYAFLVPFDNLLALATFGTGTKLLGLLAGAALLLWTIRRRRIVAPPASLILWAMLLAWMALTLLWTSDPAAGIREFQTMLQILLLYAVVSITPIEPDDLRWLLRGIIGGGIAAAIFGIYVFHYQNPIEAQLQQELGRVSIVVGQSAIDVNHFANALLLPITVLLALALNERRALVKTAYIVGFATMLAAMYETGSREALLGFGAVLVFLAIVSRKRLQMIAVMAASGLLIALNPTLWQRITEAVSTGGAGRTSIWAVGIEALKHHYLLGSGLGSFENAYDKAYIQVFQRVSTGWARDPHNLLIHYSVELGLLGVGLVVACWIAQFRLLRHIDKGSALSDMRDVATAVLIALFVSAMFIDLLDYKYLWLVFAFVAQLRALASVHPELAMKPEARRGLEAARIARRLWGKAAPTRAH